MPGRGAVEPRRAAGAAGPLPPPAARGAGAAPAPPPPVDMMATIEERRAQRRAAGGRARARPPRRGAEGDAATRNLRTLTGREGVGGVFQILRKGTRTRRVRVQRLAPRGRAASGAR